MINAAILEQTFIVEYTVFNQMCTDCQKKETNNFWKAVVQVRQKVKKVPSQLALISRQ